METPVNHHKLDKIKIYFAIETIQKTQRLQNKLLSDVVSQTLPPKGVQSQTSGTLREKFRENQTENGRVPFLNSSNNCPTDIPKTAEKHIMTPINGNHKIAVSRKQPHTSKKDC